MSVSQWTHLLTVFLCNTQSRLFVAVIFSNKSGSKHIRTLWSINAHELRWKLIYRINSSMSIKKKKESCDFASTIHAIGQLSRKSKNGGGWEYVYTILFSWTHETETVIYLQMFHATFQFFRKSWIPLEWKHGSCLQISHCFRAGEFLVLCSEAVRAEGSSL